MKGLLNRVLIDLILLTPVNYLVFLVVYSWWLEWKERRRKSGLSHNRSTCSV